MGAALPEQPTKTYLLHYSGEKHRQRLTPTVEQANLTISIHTALPNTPAHTTTTLLLNLRMINSGNETVDGIYTKLIEFPH